MRYNLPRAEQVEQLLESIRSAASELEAGVPSLDRSTGKTFDIYDLLERALADEPGFPPTSGHNGTDRRSNVPRPVEHLAIDGEPGSPADDFDIVLTQLEGAKMRVESAVRQLLTARPKPAITRKGEPGCKSCSRLPKHWVPLYEHHEKDGLCRKCWEWWVASAAEIDDRLVPPLGVVQAWRDGRKLTNKIIAEALADEAAAAEARPKQRSVKKGARRGVKRFARR